MTAAPRCRECCCPVIVDDLGYDLDTSHPNVNPLSAFFRNWEVIAGDWVHTPSAGIVETSSANALAIRKAPNHSSFGAVYVKARCVQSSLSDVDQLKIVFGFVDADNYWYLRVQWSGRQGTFPFDTDPLELRLFRRSGGYDTEITLRAEVSTPAYLPQSRNEPIHFKVCWDAATVAVAVTYDSTSSTTYNSIYYSTSGNFLYQAEYTGDPPAENGRYGIGTGASVTRSPAIDEVVLTESSAYRDPCKRCCDCRFFCGDGLPSSVEVTIDSGAYSGITGGGCSLSGTEAIATALNGQSFILDRVDGGCDPGYCLEESLVYNTMPPNVFCCWELADVASGTFSAFGLTRDWTLSLRAIITRAGTFGGKYSGDGECKRRVMLVAMVEVRYGGAVIDAWWLPLPKDESLTTRTCLDLVVAPTFPSNTTAAGCRYGAICPGLRGNAGQGATLHFYDAA